MSSNTHSIDIVDLLSQFPIFSALVDGLDFWDLIQLSRTSVAIRFLCHGFTNTNSNEPKHITGSRIRTSLRIGEHTTTRWRLYKSLTLRHCRETGHTRGTEPFGCKLCSKPVCLACIVKHSFGKQENTFVLRGRPLCKKCFKDGNPHTEHINVKGSTSLRISYSKAGLCMCTAQDGILCLDCKKKHNEDAIDQFKATCAGTGCGDTLKDPFASARICLWCNSILPNASQRKHHYDESSGLSEMQGVLIPSRHNGSFFGLPRLKRFLIPAFDYTIPPAPSFDMDRPAPAPPIASTSS